MLHAYTPSTNAQNGNEFGFVTGILRAGNTLTFNLLPSDHISLQTFVWLFRRQEQVFPYRIILVQIPIFKIHQQFERLVRKHIQAIINIDNLEEPYHYQIFLHEFRPRQALRYQYKTHLSDSAYKAGYTFYNPTPMIMHNILNPHDKPNKVSTIAFANNPNIHTIIYPHKDVFHYFDSPFLTTKNAPFTSRLIHHLYPVT